MRHPRSFGIRFGGAALLGLAAIVASGGLAAADNTTGLAGHYAIRDTVAHPGARCDYLTGDGTQGPATILVHAPSMLARNRTAGIDHQRVGWRVRLQQSTDFVHWTTVRTSTIRKAGATDQTKAALTDRAFGVTLDAFVRATLDLYWYMPGSTSVVVGSAHHRVMNYVRYLDGSFEDNVAGSCPHDLPA